MPPKCKFTREEIIQAALDIARSEGAASITARLLGAKLGSSSKPIFSVFENMELLFMSEQSQKVPAAGILPVIDENYPQILLSVQNGYGINREDAENLYRHLWIYTHGIAVLCATNVCAFTAEEISRMMTEVFISLLKGIKGDIAE